MNRILRALLLIAILPAFQAGSQEANNYSLRTQTKDLLSFSCDSYGKKFYVADMVDLVFAVSFENADAQAARRSIEGVVSKVNGFLKEQGYGEEIVSLLSSEIEKEKRRIDQYKYQFFYTAKSTYALRTEKVANLEQLLRTVGGLGSDEIV